MHISQIKTDTKSTLNNYGIPKISLKSNYLICNFSHKLHMKNLVWDVQSLLRDYFNFIQNTKETL